MAALLPGPDVSVRARASGQPWYQISGWMIAQSKSVTLHLLHFPSGGGFPHCEVAFSDRAGANDMPQRLRRAPGEQAAPATDGIGAGDGRRG